MEMYEVANSELTMALPGKKTLKAVDVGVDIFSFFLLLKRKKRDYNVIYIFLLIFILREAC
jgi:hypothetical protein